MGRSRTLINLVAVLVASAVLVVYAVTQLVASAVLDNTYPLFIELPETGGLLENKQVTYRGVAVGEVDDSELAGDGVRLTLGIYAGIEIPRQVDVVVLRQSAVGEQALDIRPHVRTDEDTPVYAEGETIRPDGILLPTKPQELLELADEVFGPVDPQSAATVVSELADAVRGRRDEIRAILVNSATFSEAVADNGANYDRLFAASRVVNATLAENREVLASLITDLANGAELVGDLRDEVDALLDTAPPTLAATSNLLERADANLHCVITDLADLNDYVARPEQLANLAEGLRVNPYFFEGFEQISPTDPFGYVWQRIHLVLEPEPMPNSHLPDKRPIPDILPGGACESPFGAGAGSAVQADWQRAVPEARVVRPANDRPEPVRQPGGGVLPASSTGALPAAGVPVAAAGQTTDVHLPATGAGLTSLLGGALLLAAAWLLRRPTTRRTTDG